MKPFHFLSALALASAALVACGNVDEQDRFDGPFEAAVQKNVLIEDFTGQRCSNCPLATEKIHEMQEAFGKEHIVAVAIHGGALGVSETDKPAIGLANEQGEQLYSYWKVETQPNGLVDRVGGLKDFAEWMGAAVPRLYQTPKVQLAATASVDEATRQLSLQVSATATEDLQGKLQVWLTESNLVRIQTLPAEWGGGNQKDYVHNHVLRHVLTPAYGEVVSADAEGHATWTATYDVPKVYGKGSKTNLIMMHVVAFVTNDETGEVLQVVEAPLAPMIN